MSADSTAFRRMAQDLLAKAAVADNLAERSQLIGMAAYWNEEARKAEGNSTNHSELDWLE